jgi:hypothetical protein
MRQRQLGWACWVFTILTAVSSAFLTWSGFAYATYRWQGGSCWIEGGGVFVHADPHNLWNPKVLGFEYASLAKCPLESPNTYLRYRSLNEFEARLSLLLPVLGFGTGAAWAWYRVRRPIDRSERPYRRGSFRVVR